MVLQDLVRYMALGMSRSERLLLEGCQKAEQASESVRINLGSRLSITAANLEHVCIPQRGLCSFLDFPWISHESVSGSIKSLLLFLFLRTGRVPTKEIACESASPDGSPETTKTLDLQ
jgi:hypothetical protein